MKIDFQSRSNDSLPLSATLLVIDLQKAIDHPSWGRRNNWQAEANVARLLAAWRSSDRPIVHIRHASIEPNSTYRPGQEGYEFKFVAQPQDNETIIMKSVACAFIGTDLEQTLRDRQIETLIVTGVITNNSVEATARVAGNLGFTTYVVSDGTFTFDRVDLDGKLHQAEDVHAISLANLHGEYTTVIDTATVLQKL